MGLIDISKLNLKLTMPKIEKIKIAKMTYRRKGDRSLTQGDKKKEFRNAKHKCQRCKKKFPAHKLCIHHKKGVANYKNKGLVDIPYIEFYMKRKKKNTYDRSKNLMVLCRNCHADVHKEESEQRKEKKKKAMKRIKQSNPYVNLGFRI